jgi:FAD binding domain
LDAFLGRKEYDTYLGRDAVNLRKWLPFNIRAFIVALERNYNVSEYILNSGNARLKGVLIGIVESYAGERGFMGVHRCTSSHYCDANEEDKVYGFLELSGKTGRAETNSGAGSASAGKGSHAGDRPWEIIHDSLADSMMERLSRYGTVPREPHEIRGSFQECRIKARISSRQIIDRDISRRTARITIDLMDTGVTFSPGDRVAIMPSNNGADIMKVLSALELEHQMEEPVPVNEAWNVYLQHMGQIFQEYGTLSIRRLLRSGKLAPLVEDVVSKVALPSEFCNTVTDQ